MNLSDDGKEDNQLDTTIHCRSVIW